ncbi:MAG: hypothetical protein MI747_03050 [Desulfobacterales bacterium]|nr:hypothetical protein [Desulfobacterales bacterium]
MPEGLDKKPSGHGWNRIDWGEQMVMGDPGQTLLHTRSRPQKNDPMPRLCPNPKRIMQKTETTNPTKSISFISILPPVF